MTRFWKVLIVTSLTLQVALLAIGLYAAADLYTWSRWASDAYEPGVTPGYWETPGGRTTAQMAGISLFLAGLAVGVGALTGPGRPLG